MQERAHLHDQPAAHSRTQQARTRRRQRDAALRVVQAKLTVGAAGDRYEREADEMADRVTAIVQRMATTTAPVADPEQISHRCGPGCLHRHAGHAHHDHPEIGEEGGELGSELTAALRRSAGRGRPLAPNVRRSMESAFGADFSGVRVHPDSDLAPRLGATAFTHGQDIHFAPGQYRPQSRAGTWLLGHELTHVVQQRPGRHVAPAHGTIRRHSSREHYILGAMTPAQVEAVAKADAKAKTVADAQSVFSRLKKGGAAPTGPEVTEALQAIREQLSALENWRAVQNADGGPLQLAQQNKGSTAYNHQWGGQLMTIRCLDGEVPCTIGDMNALPDYFGSYDDLAQVSKSIVFKTLQVIRRETYVYLKHLEARLLGISYSYDRKKEAFGGIENNAIALDAVFPLTPKVANSVKDLMDTKSMLAGKDGEIGTPTAIAADATLGRNACHFPPESWLRWREHHMRARRLIWTATSLQDLAAKANEAIAINAFGEHYLQDSYASGHLINKGFVMAVAMEHATAATKKARGMTSQQIAALQQATAHTDAYSVPAAAKRRDAERKAGRMITPGVLDDRATMAARDPQSALEAAKREGQRQRAGGASLDDAKDRAKKQEMIASGLGPNVMSFEQYRTWLNDFWLQKITNTLHDLYCVKGLEVSSPDKRNLFKIYGDGHMIGSAEGAAYTARTSEMSRKAINALIANKKKALSPPAGGPGGKPVPDVPVYSVEQIMARFPDRVKDDDGYVMSLERWATGEPMRKKIAKLVSALSAQYWKEGKLTGVVRGASLFKTVAPGLGPEHGPF